MVDLREHLEALKEIGDLITIEEEMDKKEEVAAWAAMSNRAGAQAIHFKKIQGYPEGYTIATNLLSGPGHYYYFFKRRAWRRMAVGMETDPETDYELFLALLNERAEHPILPVKVATGPCKEVIETGDQVNLLNFPFPLLHKEDGGYYGTGVLTVRDLDTDWQNWGFYRFMIRGRNEIVADFLTEPSLSSDTKFIYRKFAALNRPMPFAIVLGGAPAIMIAAAMKVPAGVSEIDIAGGLNLDPISLVKAETSDILVPADAEIVIEGEVSPTEMVEEGPYGSIKGYTKPARRPLMRVTAITHRKDPILPIVVDGSKVSDTQALISIVESARLLRSMQIEYGEPVRWIQIPPDFNLGLCITAIVPVAEGIVFRVARHIFANSNLFDKILFCEHDVWWQSLIWVHQDWNSRVHPTKGHHVLEGFPPAVMPNYGERVPGEGMPRLYIDATWPTWWKPEEKPRPTTFDQIYPDPAFRERVLKRWEELKIPAELAVRKLLPPPGLR